METNGVSLTGSSTPIRDRSLDLLRGIAILLVLDCHFGNVLEPRMMRLGLPTCEGDAGVTLFFVLSGFLVGGVLLSEWRASGRVEGKRFLLRRAFKIWPQYYIYLFATMLTGHRSLHETLPNLAHVQNYLGGIPHTWTLAVEEHAYLLLAAGLMVVAWARMSWRVLLASLAVLAGAIALWRDLAIRAGVPVFAQTHFRMDGILIGVALAVLHQFAPKRFRRLRARRSVWLLVLLTALVLLHWAPEHRPLHPLEFDLLNLAGVATLLLLFQPERARSTPNVVYRAIATLGLYSYGIYLWHVSVVAPVHSLMSRLHVSQGGWLDNGASVAAGVTAGVVTTMLIELPFLRLRDRLVPKQPRASSRLEVGTEEVMPALAPVLAVLPAHDASLHSPATGAIAGLIAGREGA